MPRMQNRLARSIVWFGVLALLSGCAAAPSPTAAPISPPAVASPPPSRDFTPRPVVHTTAYGPPQDFRITQEITSRAEVLWEGELPGTGAVSDKRENGLRILATFNVVTRATNTAVIDVTVHNTEILKDGSFVPAPFLQFDPPESFTFRVDYRRRKVDFGPAERAWAVWFDSLKGTPMEAALSEVFNANAFVAQLRDLFGRTALDFAGNTYCFRRTVTEKKEFFVPLPGPGIALGPVDVDLNSTLRYVEVAKGRKIFRLNGEQKSQFLRFDGGGLGARVRTLGGQTPPIFESEGQLKGNMEAQVDADSGWITGLDAVFTAVTGANFGGGTLSESVWGRRTVVTK